MRTAKRRRTAGKEESYQQQKESKMEDGEAVSMDRSRRSMDKILLSLSSSSPSSSSLLFQFLLLISSTFSITPKSLATPTPSPTPSSAEIVFRRNEMLVPANSTTALICEPVFNQGHFSGEDGREVEARWMRNGREVARVKGHLNAVVGAERSALRDHSTTTEPIPQIGFLVITNTRPEDEGEYWCERLKDGMQGERTRLRVAFLEEFERGQRPRVVDGGGSQQQLRWGQLVALECPSASGVPAPLINWLFNGDRIDFGDSHHQNMLVAPNGSLLIHNFSANQSGFFACESTNFVGRAVSSALFLGGSPSSPLRSVPSSPSSLLIECLSAYVRNGVLWFLIGCLTTSCVVLAYILGALFLYRLYSLRNHRHRWRRSLVSAPGFRKVIAPMNERMAPPPYFDLGGTSEV